MHGIQLRKEVLPSHKEMFLLINSQHISAQIGHRQAILEEYTNDDGQRINYNSSITFLLFKIVSDPNTIYTFDFKLNSTYVLEI
jgi:hypothetical protein